MTELSKQDVEYVDEMMKVFLTAVLPNNSLNQDHIKSLLQFAYKSALTALEVKADYVTEAEEVQDPWSDKEIANFTKMLVKPSEVMGEVVAEVKKEPKEVKEVKTKAKKKTKATKKKKTKTKVKPLGAVEMRP